MSPKPNFLGKVRKIFKLSSLILLPSMLSINVDCNSGDNNLIYIFFFSYKFILFILFFKIYIYNRRQLNFNQHAESMHSDTIFTAHISSVIYLRMACLKT